MYYKVIKNNKVIDVLDKLVYLKYQEKHNRMVLCNESEAQVFFSSDRKRFWHTENLYNIPVSGANIKCDVVELIEIDEFEYEQLRILNGKSPEKIVDSLLIDLINRGII